MSADSAIETLQQQKLLKRILSQECQQDTCSYCRTDNTCYVRTHCVHQEEVRRILLLTNGLRYASCHRHSRNTSRTNERVDLLTLREEEVHKLREEQTTCSTTAEREDTEHEDKDCLLV